MNDLQTSAEPKLSMILAGRVDPTMSFSEKVWAVCSRVPAGKVTTYAAIARELGCRAPRAVGQALHRNPHAPRVPCHRVVATNGALTGYAGGLSKKQRLLEAEGVEIIAGRVVKRCMVG
ncbi:MAG TPA: MGMT family protein [Tepidisphaeraceae bacterium]|mgnify:CR=1 FL=1|nr:MGMT family protein [Tepidisphaeraceae bacterium]